MVGLVHLVFLVSLVQPNEAPRSKLRGILRNSPKPLPSFAKATEGSPRLHAHSKLRVSGEGESIQLRSDSRQNAVSPILAHSATALKTAQCLEYNAALGKEESLRKMMKIELSMYGIAEVLHWCHDRNKGRVPGVDTAGFDKMKVLLAEKPQSGDYFTLDQFWKKRATLDLTEDEVATIDRCLYDIPNFDSEPLPQIRHKFWPQQTAAH